MNIHAFPSLLNAFRREAFQTEGKHHNTQPASDFRQNTSHKKFEKGSVSRQGMGSRERVVRGHVVPGPRPPTTDPRTPTTDNGPAPSATIPASLRASLKSRPSEFSLPTDDSRNCGKPIAARRLASKTRRPAGRLRVNSSKKMRPQTSRTPTRSSTRPVPAA